MRYLTLICLLFTTSIVLAQNNLYQRSGDNLGRTRILDIGNGESHWVMEQRYSFDSTHVHFIHCDADMNLTHQGAFRTSAPLGWMNDAASVSNGVIIGGASLGFSTLPYVLRMDNAGNVPWSKIFTDLEDGNTQVLNTFVKGDRLDIFTWSDNTRDHYYLINGFTDGSFPTALKVDAPAETEIRTDEVARVSDLSEYLVICQADTNFTFSKFLYIMHIDSSGVISARMHDHDQSMTSESESAFGLIPTSDGNWVYTCTYNDEGQGLENRLVKMSLDGTVIWSKEYFLNGEKLSIGACHETEDNGLLFSSASSTDHFFVKVDASGEVLWSHIYQQSLSQNVPTGWFFENDQGQLYAWNRDAITEMDEDINVCDMTPHEGIISQDAPFNTQIVTANTSTITPEVLEFVYYPRTGDYSLELDCQNVGIEEESESPFSISPNPTEDLLIIECLTIFNGMTYEIMDLQGNRVSQGRLSDLDLSVIDTSKLSSGMYLLIIHNGARIYQEKFVKR